MEENKASIKIDETDMDSSPEFMNSSRDNMKIPLIPDQEKNDSGKDNKTKVNESDTELAPKPEVKPFIGTYEEADEYLRDNPEIRTGYRIKYNKFCIVLKSLFMWHNETVNIWSHLLGLMVFFCIIFYVAIELENKDLSPSFLNFIKDYITLKGHSPEGVGDYISKIPLGVHISCAMICLFLSSTFHLFCCHSKDALNILSRFDYGGIAILIAGSCTPIYIYSFWCPQVSTYGYVYTSVMAAGCGIAFAVSLIPKFDAPKYRMCRAILFVVVGLSSAIPGIHIIGFRHPEYMPKPPIFLLGLGGAIYILGAVIYSTRFPERFTKGKKRKCNFDCIGNSHNIWHCFVLTAAGVHYAASVIMFKTRVVHQCPA
ncbi:unnamed protein product [Moneuplotes crassus]|uniref:Uncharacterized protein n=1 Tax=Euplotes crassus TaxID=5936 RepID=A0AAD1U6M6_EUPCR|nr:unnamed protein product [Moneuplotes crassus]